MFGNTLAIIVVRATNLLVRSALLFMLARRLAPESFAEVVLVFASVEVCKVFADLGLDTFAIRELARTGDDKSRQERHLGEYVAMKLLVGGCVFSGLMIWGAIAAGGMRSEIVDVLSWSVWTSLAMGLILDVFQARLETSRVVPAVLVTSLLACGAALALWSSQASGEASLWVFPAVEAIVVVVALGVLRRVVPLRALKPRFVGVPRILRACLPISVTGLLVMLYSRLDVFLMSALVASADLGTYGIAVRLTEPFHMVAAAFATSVFGRVSALADPLARRGVLRHAGLALGYGIFVAIMLRLFSGSVLQFALPAYVGAIPIVHVLALAIIVRSLNATLSAFLQAAGLFSVLSWIAAGNLVAMLVLMRGLVPQWGAVGAAWVLVIGEVLNSCIQMLWLLRQSHGRGHAKA